MSRSEREIERWSLRYLDALEAEDYATVARMRDEARAEAQMWVVLQELREAISRQADEDEQQREADDRAG